MMEWSDPDSLRCILGLFLFFWTQLVSSSQGSPAPGDHVIANNVVKGQAERHSVK